MNALRTASGGSSGTAATGKTGSSAGQPAADPAEVSVTPAERWVQAVAPGRIPSAPGQPVPLATPRATAAAAWTPLVGPRAPAVMMILAFVPMRDDPSRSNMAGARAAPIGIVARESCYPFADFRLSNSGNVPTVATVGGSGSMPDARAAGGRTDERPAATVVAAPLGRISRQEHERS